MKTVTQWFHWPENPSKEGWYDYTGYLIEGLKGRMYWNGSQWGYWLCGAWIHLADDTGDRWRGLADKPKAKGGE